MRFISQQLNIPLKNSIIKVMAYYLKFRDSMIDIGNDKSYQNIWAKTNNKS